MTAPHPLMQQLTAARQQAGLTLDGWAARLGIRPSTVSYLERGISRLSLAALERFAGDLGYEVVLQPAAPAQPAIHTGGNAEDCPACAPGIDKTVLYPWICPGNGPGSPAQPAMDTTGDTDTTGGAADRTGDLRALNEQAANAAIAALAAFETQPYGDLRLNAARAAGIALAAIRPVLERCCSCDGDPIECSHEAARGQTQAWADAEITRVTGLASQWAAQAVTEGQRADRAERQLNQLKAERALPSTPRDAEDDTCPAESADEQAELCTEIAARLHDLHHPGSTTFADMAHAAMAYVTTEQAHTRHWQQRAETAEAEAERQREQAGFWFRTLLNTARKVSEYGARAEQAEAAWDQYRTAWWSARIRAAKSRGAYAEFHDLLEEANTTIAQIRKLHSRHECDDCGCRLCWGLIPVCTAGCTEYPCPTVRALDAGPEQTETDQHTACDGCETCELAAELADARAAIDRVRRLCELTINASCRVQAIEQARDTLAVLDRTAPDATGSAQ